MAYKVIKEGATVHKEFGEHLVSPNEYAVSHVAVVYSLGDIIQDEDVATLVKDLYDSGDETILSLIEKVDEPKAATKKAPAKKAATKPKAKAEGK